MSSLLSTTQTQTQTQIDHSRHLATTRKLVLKLLAQAACCPHSSVCARHTKAAFRSFRFEPTDKWELTSRATQIPKRRVARELTSTRVQRRQLSTAVLHAPCTARTTGLDVPAGRAQQRASGTRGRLDIHTCVLRRPAHVMRAMQAFSLQLLQAPTHTCLLACSDLAQSCVSRCFGCFGCFGC